jgi:CRISPR-associated protein Csx14
MTTPSPSFSVNVDPTNPGQFFACCGLLELADRLWPNAEGWFANDGRKFHIACGEHSLSEIVDAITNTKLVHLDTNDPYSSPIRIGDPFRQFDIDWWTVIQTGARDLKIWAGTMESFGIAKAMQCAMRDARFQSADLFDIGVVVMNPDDPSKKKEPYYFDARRSPNAHSLDVGFAPNDLGLTTTAHPAVELLCLIGLQVARPAHTDTKRIYDYSLWTIPLAANLLLAAATGAIELPGAQIFRFENWFRTGQKKHKAFRSAIPLSLVGVQR